MMRRLKMLLAAATTLAGLAFFLGGALTSDVRLLAIGIWAWVAVLFLMAWAQRSAGLSIQRQLKELGADQSRLQAGIMAHLSASSSELAGLQESFLRNSASSNDAINRMRGELQAEFIGLHGKLINELQGLKRGLCSLERKNDIIEGQIKSVLLEQTSKIDGVQREVEKRGQEMNAVVLDSLRSTQLDISFAEERAAGRCTAIKDQVERKLMLYSEVMTAEFREIRDQQQKFYDLTLKSPQCEVASSASFLTALQSESGVKTARRIFDQVKPDLLIDIAALQILRDRVPAVRVAPPMTRYSMEPGAVLAVVDEIFSSKPEVVVELGSGSSTVWLAGALAQLGRGKLISIEHSEGYWRQTEGWIRDNHLTQSVDLRLAKIETCTLRDGTCARWYNVDHIKDVTQVEVLLIDGPPQSVSRTARLPAFEQFRDRLAPGARIFVDDATRKGEERMLHLWRESDEKLSQPIGYIGRMALLRYGPPS